MSFLSILSAHSLEILTYAIIILNRHSVSQLTKRQLRSVECMPFIQNMCLLPAAPVRTVTTILFQKFRNGQLIARQRNLYKVPWENEPVSAQVICTTTVPNPFSCISLYYLKYGQILHLQRARRYKSGVCFRLEQGL